jgi:hypothetical protein
MQQHTLDLEQRQGAALDTSQIQPRNGTVGSSTLSKQLNGLKSLVVRGLRSDHSKKRRITLVTVASGLFRRRDTCLGTCVQQRD